MALPLLGDGFHGTTGLGGPKAGDVMGRAAAQPAPLVHLCYL